jgi:hypothetical protein
MATPHFLDASRAFFRIHIRERAVANVLIHPLQAAARDILGEKGIAISCVPAQALLHPWDELRVTVAAATDMLGVYQDVLHVRCGTLPAWDIPLRLGVVGTPLQIQTERRLPDGLTVERVSETTLAFGDVPSGIRHTRTFHVVNTSNLDMKIDWQVLVHCSHPERKVRSRCPIYGVK